MIDLFKFQEVFVAATSSLAMLCLKIGRANGRPGPHSLKIKFSWLMQSQPQNPHEIPTIPLVCYPNCVLLYYTAIHSRGDEYALWFLPPADSACCHQFGTNAGILWIVGMGFGELAGNRATHAAIATQVLKLAAYPLATEQLQPYDALQHTAPITTTILCCNNLIISHGLHASLLPCTN